ncbi:hypothetical protein [Kutzneria sp. CA-103260]|uniref:hypothetical protein n=1 Tax=Kutzneria sp. CA-103260 TaxID=2802641 RepID=UPI001BAE15F6|nr:hypothetical protein [Kutzneria sp. CA-103260]QUQ64321.1 hypothetical protein JJ691_20410 [Kutzneria sp. CA-103260]
MKTLVSSLLGFAFVFGLLGTLSVGRLIPDPTEQTMASVTMVLVSLVAGSLLARREPVKSFLASRPVLWFLFLFNVTAGVLVYLFVGGAQGLMTAIGLGVVGLGAGSGLVLRRRPV